MLLKADFWVEKTKRPLMTVSGRQRCCEGVKNLPSPWYWNLEKLPEHLYKPALVGCCRVTLALTQRCLCLLHFLFPHSHFTGTGLHQTGEVETRVPNNLGPPPSADRVLALLVSEAFSRALWLSSSSIYLTRNLYLLTMELHFLAHSPSSKYFQSTGWWY